MCTYVYFVLPHNFGTGAWLLHVFTDTSMSYHWCSFTVSQGKETCTKYLSLVTILRSMPMACISSLYYRSSYGYHAHAELGKFICDLSCKATLEFYATSWYLECSVCMVTYQSSVEG